MAEKHMSCPPASFKNGGIYLHSATVLSALITK